MSQMNYKYNIIWAVPMYVFYLKCVKHSAKREPTYWQDEKLIANQHDLNSHPKCCDQ